MAAVLNQQGELEKENVEGSIRSHYFSVEPALHTPTDVPNPIMGCFRHTDISYAHIKGWVSLTCVELGLTCVELDLLV